MHTSYSKPPFRGCNLDFCYLGLPSSPPSSLYIYIAANEQGGVGGELVDKTDSTSDIIVGAGC
jgi:hypothetical protein